MDLDQLLDALGIVFTVIGVASAAAATLRGLLPALRAYALKTSFKADDKIVECFASFLSVLVALGDIAKWVADRLGLNPRSKPAITQNGKVLP